MIRVYREGNNSTTSESLWNKRVEPRIDNREDSQDGVKTGIAVYTKLVDWTDWYDSFCSLYQQNTYFVLKIVILYKKW